MTGRDVRGSTSGQGEWEAPGVRNVQLFMLFVINLKHWSKE